MATGGASLPGDKEIYFNVEMPFGGGKKLGFLTQDVSVTEGTCSDLEQRTNRLKWLLNGSSWGKDIISNISDKKERGFFLKFKVWWVNWRLEGKHGEKDAVGEYERSLAQVKAVGERLNDLVKDFKKFNIGSGSIDERMSLVEKFRVVSGYERTYREKEVHLEFDIVEETALSAKCDKTVHLEYDMLGADAGYTEVDAAGEEVRRNIMEHSQDDEMAFTLEGDWEVLGEKQSYRWRINFKKCQKIDERIDELRSKKCNDVEEHELEALLEFRRIVAQSFAQTFFSRVSVGIGVRSYSGFGSDGTLRGAYINYQKHCLVAKQRVRYEEIEPRIRELQTTVGQITKLSRDAYLFKGPDVSVEQEVLKELRDLSCPFGEVDITGREIRKLQVSIRGLREIESDERSIAERGKEVARLKKTISSSLKKTVGFKCRDAAAEEAFLKKLEGFGEAEQGLMIFKTRQRRMDKLVGALVKHEETAKGILTSMDYLRAKRRDLEERRVALSEAYAPFRVNDRSKYSELRDRLQSVIDRRSALGEDCSDVIGLLARLRYIRDVVGSRCYREEARFKEVLRYEQEDYYSPKILVESREMLADPDFTKKVDERLSYNPSALFAPKQESYLSEDMRLNKGDFNLDKIAEAVEVFESSVLEAETGVFQAPQEAMSVLHGMVERRNKLKQRLLKILQEVTRLELDAPGIIKGRFRILEDMSVPDFKELDGECRACAAQVSTPITVKSREEAEFLLERVKLRAEDRDITQMKEMLGDADLAREMDKMEKQIAGEDKRRTDIREGARGVVNRFEGRVLPEARERIIAARELYGKDIEEKFTEASENMEQLKYFVRMYKSVLAGRRPNLNIVNLERDLARLERDLPEAKRRFAEWQEDLSTMPPMLERMRGILESESPLADEIGELEGYFREMRDYRLPGGLSENLFKLSREMLEVLLRDGLKNMELSLTAEQKAEVDLALGKYGLEGAFKAATEGAVTAFKGLRAGMAKFLRQGARKPEKLPFRDVQSAPGRLQGDSGDLDRLEEKPEDLGKSGK